jgi:predicted Mrr-cat superfamily restriction endonuclease
VRGQPKQNDLWKKKERSGEFTPARPGNAESLFEKKSVVAIGWKQMKDLSPLKTRADFKKRYEEIYADVKPAAIPVNTANS